ncbi:hypothetical protein PHYSODRAFT_323252 [Phytophthora sojae]|uniref:Uncharacterized protein n=1 Tax=Phytophthora sojae (strain P6497) TaxID=1094619 RepID=G4YL35_PHYSP|nr:hypothetical protein PHYSODRAFT_323252 [Phytophthora sojae]EGZ29790.1 hypothetical protein PHYSODRAFT_323252 [Phytophthora sojae]|eukprot:XP_009517065.1 hypothetical protein PHYSODRAFT_323252 [Phytophthora sojae]
MLLHVKAEAPYQDAESEYATKTALKFAARVMWQKDSAKMKGFVGPLHYVPLAKTLCVYAFAPYAMFKLQWGGTFECRRLLTGNKRTLPDNEEDEETITTGFMGENVESMEHGMEEGVLYVPKKPKCVPLDAWVPGFGGFQIVVDAADDIKSGTAEALGKLGPDGNRLYFLLPPKRYQTFTKKSPQTIEQTKRVKADSEMLQQVNGHRNLFLFFVRRS